MDPPGSDTPHRNWLGHNDDNVMKDIKMSVFEQKSFKKTLFFAQ